MRHLIKLFIMILFASSSGASDEPTRYVYDEFNIDNASKYTISTGDMHEFSCLMTQIIFSQEALIAMKNKKKFDFMNSDFTPTSIDLYKNKVYWVDLDLNTKIKNNFVKFKPISGEEQLFELIHKDPELIFRIKTPHQGSTLVCDFPFRELDSETKYLYNENHKWVEFFEYEGGVFYIDTDTIKEHGGYVYYWTLRGLTEPSPWGDMSVKTYIQGDCELNRFKNLTNVWYTKPMGRGTSDVEKLTGEWETPDSVFGGMFNYVCDYVK